MRIAIVAVAIAACSETPTGKPDDAVRAVHAAIAARDCGRLLAAVADDAEAVIRGDGCERTFDDHRALGVELRGIAGVAPDGRKREEFLVTATLRAGGADRSVIHRVARRGARWVVTAMNRSPAPPRPSTVAAPPPVTPPPPDRPPPPPDDLDPDESRAARPDKPPPLDPAHRRALAERGVALIGEAIERATADLAAARAARDGEEIRRLEIRLARLRETQRMRAAATGSGSATR